MAISIAMLNSPRVAFDPSPYGRHAIFSDSEWFRWRNSVLEACFGGNVLTNWYEIKVVSVDGNAGIVDLQAAWRIRSFCLQICCTKSVAFVPVLFFALLCSKVLPLRFRCASFGPFLSFLVHQFSGEGPAASVMPWRPFRKRCWGHQHHNRWHL